MSADDILDLIDTAIGDCTVSSDAMRCNAPAAANPVATTGVMFAEACANLQSLRSRLVTSNTRLVIACQEVPVTDFRIEERRPRPSPVVLGAIGIASGFEQRMLALAQNERDEFVAYWQASPWSFEQAFHAWRMHRMMEPIRVSLSAWAEQLVVALRGAQRPMGMFSHALRLEPWPHGWVEPCFCHPTPFPAARDYRRRTKHRNRRRR